MKDQKTIKICPKDHLTTPLIWTFAFIGAEWWCPLCGYKTGMFGPAREMSHALELKALHDAYFERAKPFLEYQSSMSGAMIEDESGKLVPMKVSEAEYEYGAPISIGEVTA